MLGLRYVQRKHWFAMFVVSFVGIAESIVQLVTLGSVSTYWSFWWWDFIANRKTNRLVRKAAK